MTFRLIYELEPPRVPDLKKVMLQLEIMGPVVDSFLIPDNHLGQPGLSSVALAIEVLNQGFTPIAAINARDRNALRLRSDLLTLRAYGVEEVLLLYGDAAAGRIGLTVREMLDDPSGEGMRRGVVATIGRPLGWRARADFLFTKLSFDNKDAAVWKGATNQQVYCGVIALSGRDMAEKVIDRLPDLSAPPGFIEAFNRNGEAGFKATVEQLAGLSSSGINGAHLVVPDGRRRFAQILAEWRSDVAR